jgi:hypothetical protein
MKNTKQAKTTETTTAAPAPDQFRAETGRVDPTSRSYADRRIKPYRSKTEEFESNLFGYLEFLDEEVAETKYEARRRSDKDGFKSFKAHQRDMIIAQLKQAMDALSVMRKLIRTENRRIGPPTLLTDPEATLAAAQADPVGSAIKFTWSGKQSRIIPMTFSARNTLEFEDLMPFEQKDPHLTDDSGAWRHLVVDTSFMHRAFEVLLREQGCGRVKEEDDRMSLLFAVGLNTKQPAALLGSASREDVSRFVARMLAHPGKDKDEDLARMLDRLWKSTQSAWDCPFE